MQPEFQKYIDLNHISKSKTELTFKASIPELKLIQKEKEKELRNFQNNLNQLLSTTDDLPDFPKPIIKWISQKLRKLKQKQYRLSIHLLESQLSLITEILHFINQSKSGTMKMNLLKSDLNLDNCEKLQSYKKRHSSLKFLYSGLQIDECCRYGTSDLSEIWKAMTDKANELSDNNPSNEEITYFPPNEFDEVFMRYICNIRISMKFLSIVKEMPQYDTIENFHCLLTKNGSKDFVDFIVSKIPKRGAVSVPPKNRPICSPLPFSDSDNEDKNNQMNEADQKGPEDNNNQMNEDDEQEPEAKNLNGHFVDFDFLNVSQALDSIVDAEEQVEDLQPVKISLNRNNAKTKHLKHKSFAFLQPSKKEKDIKNQKILELMNQEVTSDTFQVFLKSLFLLLKQGRKTTHAVKTLFLCSVYRALFDFYYIENSAIFYNRPLNSAYIRTGQDILNQSPTQLGLNSLFIGSNFNDVPIYDFLTSDSNFLLSSYYLNQVQFLNNPLDMAIAIKTAEKYINEVINLLLFLDDNVFDVGEVQELQEKGPNILMKAIYALDPISCPSGVLKVITVFKNLFNQFPELTGYLTSFATILDYYKHISELNEFAQNH